MTAATTRSADLSASQWKLYRWTRKEQDEIVRKDGEKYRNWFREICWTFRQGRLWLEFAVLAIGILAAVGW